MAVEPFKLWLNATACLMADDKAYQLIKNSAIVTQKGKITWIGPKVELPEAYNQQAAKETIDLADKLVTPGLIDCHTHCVFAGNRANEFSMKLQGISYEEILKQGGGIYSTVRATRAILEDELYELAHKRVTHFLQQGVTTIEIKSGYGLDYVTERKMLNVAKRLADQLPLTISKTFLGAHVLAPEFDSKQSYINYLADEVLPQLVQENLVDAVDAFCDSIAFDVKTLKKLFQKAKEYNLGLKVHSDQLSNSLGAKEAATLKAWSADHLEYIDEQSLKVMADMGTVAVLLPGAFYYLQEKQKPPIEKLRANNIPIALATDCNPGSSPCFSLLNTLNLGCVLFKLTPFEALKAVTRNGAKALGMSEKKGQLSPGFDADFVAWDVSHPDELVYYLGANFCEKVIINGDIVYQGTKEH